VSRQRVIERTVFLGSSNAITNEFSWRDERTLREGFIDFSDVTRYELWLSGLGVVLDTLSVDGTEEIDLTRGFGRIAAKLNQLTIPAGCYNARIRVWRPQDSAGWQIAHEAHPLNRLVYNFA